MYRALNENVLEKAEIQSAYLQDSFAIQQKIRSLQVAVNDPVVVQVMDASQQLSHQRLHLTCTATSTMLIGAHVPI